MGSIHWDEEKKLQAITFCKFINRWNYGNQHHDYIKHISIPPKQKKNIVKIILPSFSRLNSPFNINFSLFFFFVTSHKKKSCRHEKYQKNLISRKNIRKTSQFVLVVRFVGLVFFMWKNEWWEERWIWEKKVKAFFIS